MPDSKRCAPVLDQLQEVGLTFGDLVLFVSDPANKRGNDRWLGFFSVPGRVQDVLDFWVSSANSPTGRQAVCEWSINFVRRLVGQEAHAASRSRLFYSHDKDVNASFLSDFSIERVRHRLLELCPTTFDIFRAFSTTTRQRKQSTETSEKRKDIAIIGLAARSQKNSYVQQVLGLYTYASGAQRQVMSVLSHLGITCSYPTLTGRTSVPQAAETPSTRQTNGDDDALSSESDQDDIDRPHAEAQAPRSQVTLEDKTSDSIAKRALKRAVGLLKLLSDSSMSVAQQKAQTHLLANVYDNINMLFKIAEQILGRKDTQQNGTCATAFELFGASVHDMRTSDLVDSLANAAPLSLEDVLLSRDENALLTKCMEHTVLRIVVTYGGERFERFRKEVDATLPVTEDRIPLHKTAIYPLPAMNIDESSTTGNAEVLTEIFKSLKVDMESPDFTRYVKIISGDQLSISRIRSLVQNRAGHETLGQSFLWALCMPGLFHYKMAATHGILESHFGSQSQRDPGSLAFHNTVLDRKPIVLTSLPPFRTSRDLIFVSLYSRVLHCLLLVSGSSDLEEYSAKVTFPELCAHAKALVSQYASAAAAEVLREEREEERRAWDAAMMDIDEDDPGAATPNRTSHAGDTVFENAVLFMRDALVLREFTDAVKIGDSGRVVNVLKLWTLSFRGSGRLKYAYEMLHLIHNLTHVWPAPLRKIVLQNWLVNPTGKPNAWVEVDLMQEHLNFWIKTIYKAHGSNASWEWLTMISPCVDILRRLATQINTELGARQGTKHTSPDLEKDIAHLMTSLQEHAVYEINRGRRVESEQLRVPIPNVVALGCANLLGPLTDFNAHLARLQRRCHMKPLSGSPTGSQPMQPHSPLIPDPSISTGEAYVAPQLSSSPDYANEEEYWREVDTLPWVDSSEGDDGGFERALFTLETAGDVALDMDDLDTQFVL
ncbi:hypothetical protein C8Q73DRAFT_748529 [Cubamyces lactineus]|nr:hypothetical protein C8Q73DRAFT_748529 [Cubamyces lactineus]